jgi:hypothetical protein
MASGCDILTFDLLELVELFVHFAIRLRINRITIIIMIITTAAIAPSEKIELEFEFSVTELVAEVSIVMLEVAVNGVVVERVVDCVLLAIDEEVDESCGVTLMVVEPELPEFSGSPE